MSLSSESSELESPVAVADGADSSVSAGGIDWPRAFLRRLRVSVVLLVCYALSIGPMYWLWFESVYLRGSRFIGALYQPLRLLTLIPGVGDLLEDYIYLWIVLGDLLRR